MARRVAHQGAPLLTLLAILAALTPADAVLGSAGSAISLWDRVDPPSGQDQLEAATYL
jgi:hypothetical protein